MNQITEPKYAVGNTVHGKSYGVFAITGRRWSDTVGEYIYGVIQLDDQGNKASREMNMVESCFD